MRGGSPCRSEWAICASVEEEDDDDSEDGRASKKRKGSQGGCGAGKGDKGAVGKGEGRSAPGSCP